MGIHLYIQNIYGIFFPFRLAYDIEALLSIEYEFMTLYIASKARLNLDESQQRRLVQLNELDEVQLRARQAIEVAQAKMKKVWGMLCFVSITLAIQMQCKASYTHVYI